MQVVMNKYFLLNLEKKNLAQILRFREKSKNRFYQFNLIINQFNSVQ